MSHRLQRFSLARRGRMSRDLVAQGGGRQEHGARVDRGQPTPRVREGLSRESRDRVERGDAFRVVVRFEEEAKGAILRFEFLARAD